MPLTGYTGERYFFNLMKTKFNTSGESTTKYGNVPILGFRSKKEARFAELLWESEIPFTYESRKFELIPKFKFPHWGRFGKKFKLLETVRAMTYTPDFFITTPLNDYIIEIKGFKTPGYTLKKKLFLYWLKHNEPNSIFIEINSIAEMKTVINKIKKEL